VTALTSPTAAPERPVSFPVFAKHADTSKALVRSGSNYRKPAVSDARSISRFVCRKGRYLWLETTSIITTSAALPYLQHVKRQSSHSASVWRRVRVHTHRTLPGYGRVGYQMRSGLETWPIESLHRWTASSPTLLLLCLRLWFEINPSRCTALLASNFLSGFTLPPSP
jgi:hypothetical protein